MATQWVLGKVSEALAPTVSSTVSSAGSFAGGAVNALGNSINGVGETINGSIRRYGDGVKDYGNGIMDWTSADGLRAATASNPLGLSAGKTGGKRQVTGGGVYRAPPTTPTSANSKTLMTTSKTAAPQKKIEPGTPRKALPGPPGAKPAGAVKKAAGAPPVKKPPTAPLKPVQNAAKTVTPNPGAMRKKPAEGVNGAAKPPGAAAAKKPTPVKPNGSAAASKPLATTTANKAKLPGPNPTRAANPLGLSF
ncbi:hypothetical protein A1O7_09388 [Cladophialophora yegresii CBS 114405]|uniref:Uncharacterized protein n=1 Tax=Cladophialophora yegresii CBS 114405 TaxID=1182544 RepID=W9VPI2_9EURO|nr:uncharacterized protein A1O7_09388 [Cladophialophora yegresii CBS 114405]EXJ54051.1 hypothetical protein A1O7_09388 [Cladophialophora yegresii CBS 114405]